MSRGHRNAERHAEKILKKFLTSCVGCDRMSTTKQGTHTDRQSGIWANGTEFGRVACQVIPPLPANVCMHGGHTNVYPPTRTQGKAENTKNFFLTSCVGCDRIKLHRTAKATRWTAKAEKIVLDILCRMWYNKDKLKSRTARKQVYKSIALQNRDF